MNPVTRAILVGSGAVVVYDTAASLVSLATGVDYAAFGYGSLLIYAATGFVAARHRNSTFTGGLAGGALGLVDATLGWSIAALLGPGRLPPDMAQSPGLVAGVVMIVVVQAAFAGLAGGVVAKLLSWRARPAHRRTTP
jgi:hypothetical protein